MSLLSIFDWSFPLGPYRANLEMILLWLLIFGVGFIIDKIIKKYVKRFLKKSNLGIENKKVTILRILSQILFLITFVIAFQVFRVGELNAAKNISLSAFMEYNLIEVKQVKISIVDVFLIVLTLILSRLAVNVIKLLLSRRFKNNPDFDEGTEYVYVQLTKYIIYIFAGIISLQMIGVNLDLLIGGGAALLVGLGLGLQDVFRDFFSGLILLFEGTIKVGDIVEIQDNGSNKPIIARVLNINVRTSKIQTREGTTLIIPNSKLTQENVDNWSLGSELTRFSIPVGVAYGSNTELVRDLLKQAALSHPKVKKTHPVFVRLLNFGDNALEMDLVFWADQSWEIEKFKSDIRFEIDRLFREYNITIPFPQRTVHYASDRGVEPLSSNNVVHDPDEMIDPNEPFRKDYR